jgi:L-alanine-DL-glutamate epimerase-like enolase superfamily enzyme
VDLNLNREMRALDSITVHRLAVPLIQPYRLAFGTVERYDSLIVEATDREGRRGLGEATLLTGYTDEAIEDCWRTARAMARQLAGRDMQTARAKLSSLAATHPFTATAFGTAIEMLEEVALYQVPETASVPLVGLLDAKNEQAMASEADRLLAAGYRTLKLKVGFDPAGDAARVKMAQRAVQGRATLRIDANQGYSREQGIAFVRALEPEGIELFEQPCAADDWDSHLAVARAARVPLMLDESIYGIADIEKAAALRCAAYIKVKLMKFITLQALEDAIRRIRQLGMKPVLGNGVACDLGCWLEGLAAMRLMDNAGEMNGFLKTRASLLAEPLDFRDGALRMLTGYAPQLDAQAVTRHRLESVTCAASGAVKENAA